MLGVITAYCHKAPYAECLYAECSYAGCRGTLQKTLSFKELNKGRCLSTCDPSTKNDDKVILHVSLFYQNISLRISS